MAIVFTDAVASTSAMRMNEIAALHSMDAAIRLFLAHIEQHDGQLLNLTGDGGIAAFASVANALTCATKFQDALAADASEGRLQFRVGVHLGDIFHHSERFYGDSLNVAARIQAAAPPGAICVSQLVYAAVRGRPEFAFEYLGPKLLKNIAEPLELYRVYGSEVAAPMLVTRRPDLMAGQSGRTLETLSRPSIAVLPFRNLSADPSQHFFAEGVADDIITSLTRFRHIDVIARGSSFVFKGKELPLSEIGSQLRARYIASGSIRAAGNRVRATIELADALTERMIWAERYDRPLEDIFAIQEEIASLAVGAMSVTIEESEVLHARARLPQSMDAYGFALKAHSHALHYTADENIVARSLYEKAIKASPDYGRALAGLSRSHNLAWRYRWVDDPAASLHQAFEIAVQAVESDPNDARGYAELGYVRLYRKEHDRSVAAYRRALSLNPNDANILAEMGDALAHAGQSEEALTLVERAMRLNPFYPDRYLWAMANAHMKLRRYTEAVECVQRMNNPTQGRRILACCLAHLGRLDEARQQAALIREFDPGFSAEHWTNNICPDRRPEDIDLFLTGLKAAGL